MSTTTNPSVATNGLVMYTDITNTKKSWLGQPTVNQFAIPIPDASGNVTFSVQGTTGFQRIYSGTYGGYEIQPTDVVYKYVVGASGCHYHGNDINITTGQTPTWSFDYYIDPSTTGYPVVNYLANIESSVGVGISITDPTTSIIGTWKRAAGTGAAATANGTFRALLYPGSCGSQLATSGFILYKNPQVELNSYATPFVAGTRASTNAVIDLTSNSLLTAVSLTYDSSNTYKFNGTSDNIRCGSPVNLPTGSMDSTVLVWCYPDSTGPTDQYTGLVAWGGRSSNDARLLSLYTNGTTMYVSSAFWSNDYTPNSLVVNANEWNMVGMISRGRAGVNNVTLYCGNSSGLSSQTGSSSNNATALATTGQNLTIGCTDVPGRYFKGTIGMVKIYNRELSSNEISQEYNAMRGRYGL